MSGHECGPGCKDITPVGHVMAYGKAAPRFSESELTSLRHEFARAHDEARRTDAERALLPWDRMTPEARASAYRSADAMITVLTGPPPPRRARVLLFHPSGKYQSTEEWRVPTREQVLARGGNGGDLGTAYCMAFSPDYHDLGGPVLVPTQEPWGSPHLISALSSGF